MIGITSSMSPGYLQINPYFNESASKLSKQLNSFNENIDDSKSADKIKKDREDTLRLISKKEREIKEKLDLIAKKEREKDRLELESKKEKEIEKEDSKKIVSESEEEKSLVDELKRRELEVISHETAHVSAGGRFASAPMYTRTHGPDGKSYITGGEVSISVPPSDDPEETIRNMEQVKAAALAPMSPSPQDMSVAATAANAQAQAELELASQQAAGGMQPQPVRSDFDATDRVPAGLPMTKKYQSSVENDLGQEGLVTSIDRTREEVSDNAEGSIFVDWAALMGRGSLNNDSKLAPEDNLYNTRQARKVYLMASSPKGLWTVDNGFELTSSSPALEQAKILNLAA